MTELGDTRFNKTDWRDLTAAVFFTEDPECRPIEFDALEELIWEDCARTIEYRDGSRDELYFVRCLPNEVEAVIKIVEENGYWKVLVTHMAEQIILRGTAHAAQILRYED